MSAAEIGQAVQTQTPAEARLAQRDAQARPAVSWWGDVWRRFRRQRLALVAAVVLIVMALLALMAPAIAPYDPTEQFRREGLTAVGEPLPPNARFWLGTDGLGRDLLSRLLWGGRISLAIGISATTIVMATALVVGGAAGFAGAKTDFVLMRLVDLMISIPQLFVMLLLVVILQPGAWVVVLVVSLFGWPYPSRVFRSQILSLKEADFVLAARSLGVPERRIFLRHVLPHLLPLVTIYAALSMPGVIFAEASLSFLGLGVPPPTPSWGSMIQDGLDYYRAAPWLVLFPGMAITLTVVSFNLVASGLREAMDPTQRGR
ncbi:MAG: transporter permease [Thermomicrobiales bacterium]|jgi:peptide/nickel transport system permease protein|nr:transporter permease [Thermomicrobiales bacterium]